MPARDEFRQATKGRLAQRAGYLCSHPKCRRPTIGPVASGDGTINVGEAAHITAAAQGGPRYDPSLSSEERRSQANGIWMCGLHAKEVDSDYEHFTIEKLRDWKSRAEASAFDALTTGKLALPLGMLAVDAELAVPAPVFLIGMQLEAGFGPVVDVTLAGDVVRRDAVVR
jgi:hypothetical protein